MFRSPDSDTEFFDILAGDRNKTEYICFKQEGAIFTLSGKLLNLVDQFPYLSSKISSTENEVNICLVKAWKAIDRLLIIWKSDVSDKIKRDFLQAVAVSILLYGCTTWTLTRQIEKKLNWNNKGMPHGVVNKS